MMVDLTTLFNNFLYGIYILIQKKYRTVYIYLQYEWFKRDGGVTSAFRLFIHSHQNLLTCCSEGITDQTLGIPLQLLIASI